MTQPGSPQSIIPVGADYVVREIADLKRQMRELQGAVSATTTLIPQSKVNGLGPISPSAANVWTYTGCAARLVVPVGYSRCFFIAVATVGATCTTAGGSYLGSAMKVVKNGSTDIYGGIQGALSNNVPTSGIMSTIATFTSLIDSSVTPLVGGETLDWQTWHYEGTPANIAGSSIGSGMNVLAVFLR